MPCNADYMEPTRKERNSKLIAQLIVWAHGRINPDIVSEQWIVDAADSHFGNAPHLNELARILCGLCRDHLAENVIYDGRDPMARKLADWWDEHKEADRKRAAEELADKLNAQLVKSALAKLTPEEIEALGL